MNKESTVSVIIPTFNSQKTIIRTIKSLLYPKERKIEIIIVDDGSTDNTVKIVNDFIKDNTDKIPILLIVNQHIGVSAARNAGFSLAKGDYICFLDSDDELSEGVFENIPDNEQADMYIWGRREVTENGKTDVILNNNHNEKIRGTEALCRWYRKEMPLCMGEAIYKKSFLKQHEISFLKGNQYAEDTFFNQKSLLNAQYVKLVKDNFLVVHLTPKSLVRSGFQEYKLAALKLNRIFLKELEQTNIQEAKDLCNYDYIVLKLLYCIEICREYSYVDSKKLIKKYGLLVKYPKDLSVKKYINMSKSIQILLINYMLYTFWIIVRAAKSITEVGK